MSRTHRRRRSLQETGIGRWSSRGSVITSRYLLCATTAAIQLRLRRTPRRVGGEVTNLWLAIPIQEGYGLAASRAVGQLTRVQRTRSGPSQSGPRSITRRHICHLFTKASNAGSTSTASWSNRRPLAVLFTRRCRLLSSAQSHTSGPFQSFFHGIIDEVRFSNIARYKEDFVPEQRFEPDEHTMALYHFDEGSGRSAPRCFGQRTSRQDRGGRRGESERTKETLSGSFLCHPQASFRVPKRLAGVGRWNVVTRTPVRTGECLNLCWHPDENPDCVCGSGRQYRPHP